MLSPPLVVSAALWMSTINKLFFLLERSAAIFCDLLILGLPLHFHLTTKNCENVFTPKALLLPRRPPPLPLSQNARKGVHTHSTLSPTSINESAYEMLIPIANKSLL